MKHKNTKSGSNFKHLENAVDITKPESANDCTGYVPTLTGIDEKGENLSDLMNVPTSLPIKKKNVNIPIKIQ